jgi:hypothetical protein
MARRPTEVLSVAAVFTGDENSVRHEIGTSITVGSVAFLGSRKQSRIPYRRRWVKI